MSTGPAPRTARAHHPRRAARFLRHPVAAPLGALAAALAGAAYLFVTDPHQEGQLLPRCAFNFLTGLLCPGCGGTRMAYDLMHGDLAAAWSDNAALLALGVPLAIVLGGRWLVEGVRGRRWRPRIGARGAAVFLGITVAWGIVRNITG